MLEKFSTLFIPSQFKHSKDIACTYTGSELGKIVSVGLGNGAFNENGEDTYAEQASTSIVPSGAA